MKFISFFKKYVDPNPTESFVENVLTEMESEIEKNLSKKCYAFSISKDNRLFSLQYTYATTLIAELEKGNKVVLVSDLEPFKKIILNQVKQSVKVNIEKEDETYWIIESV